MQLEQRSNRLLRNRDESYLRPRRWSGHKETQHGSDLHRVRKELRDRTSMAHHAAGRSPSFRLGSKARAGADPAGRLSGPKSPFTEIPVGIMRGQPSPAAVTRVETSLDPSSYASREVSLHCSSLHHGRDVYVHSPHSTPTSTGCFLSNLPWCRVLERMALRRLGRRGEQGQAGGHSEVEDGVPVPEVAMHGLCLGAGGAPQKHLLDPS